MRYLFTVFFMMVLFTGCSFSRGTMQKCYQDYFEEPDEEQLDQIHYPGLVDVIFSYAVQLRYEKQVVLKQSCALFDAKLEKVRLRFGTLHILELQEGRRLMVEIVEGLIERMNNYVGVHEQLGGRRFSYRDIEMTIEFESFYTLFTDPTYLGRADLRDGMAYFHTAELYNNSHVVWDCKQEAYELTRQLVEIEKRVGAPYIEELERQQRELNTPERYFYYSKKRPY